MSGGSYNYLCYKDIEDLFPWGGNLEQMADRLAGLGYAEDAAKETVALILRMRQFQVWGDSMIDRLGPVWKAVEWWDSCDSSEDRVKEALAEYRGEKP